MAEQAERVLIIGLGNKAKHYRSHYHKSVPRIADSLSAIRGAGSPSVYMDKDLVAERRKAVGNLRRRKKALPGGVTGAASGPKSP